MHHVCKMYECSTGHLPEETARAIDAGTFAFRPAMSRPEGWLFHVPEDITEDAADSEGITCPRFLSILHLAQDAGCHWVLFDCDVPQVEYLPGFDW